MIEIISLTHLHNSNNKENYASNHESQTQLRDLLKYPITQL